MEQINLNIIPDGVMPVCHASQFDRDRTIRFNLTENGAAYTLAGTETIKCKIKKPDNTENVIDVTNTSSTYVEVVFGYDDLDVSGDAMCELVIIDGSDISGSRNFLLRIEADAYDGSVFEERSASGEIASFETNFIDNLTECIVDIDAVQAGSGTPSPDNPRPISGFSALNVTRTGKNLWGHNDVTIESAEYVIDNEDIYLPEGTYVIQWKFSGTTGAMSGRVDDVDGNVIATFGGTISGGLNGRVITIPTGKTGVKFKLYSAAIGTYSDFEISIGSTIPEYIPYNGQTYNIPFVDDQDDPITVYGGTLNVTTGELTITHGYIEFDGSENWINVGGDFPFAFQLDTYISNKVDHPLPEQGIITNLFTLATEEVPTTNAIRWQINGTMGRLYVYDYTHIGDLAGFKQMLSDNKLQMIYKLATPTEIQLTPTEVRTLLNDNNIFADTGDIEVKYLIEVI